MKRALDSVRVEEAEAEKKNETLMRGEDEISKLRKYQSVVSSSFHPDTGRPVPWVMRMCAFIPTNLPIIFGMLMTKPTPANTAFWQWTNQS